MRHIIKKRDEDLYLEDYENGFIWTLSIMEAKVFLTKMHAIDIARLAEFETEII